LTHNNDKVLKAAIAHSTGKLIFRREELGIKNGSEKVLAPDGPLTS